MGTRQQTSASTSTWPGYTKIPLRTICILKGQDAESYQRSVESSKAPCLGCKDRLCLSKLKLSGVLVECDPSIKSIIMKIDAQDHAFIVEELDDQTLVIKENMLSILKQKLDDILRETQAVADESDMD